MRQRWRVLYVAIILIVILATIIVLLPSGPPNRNVPFPTVADLYGKYTVPTGNFPINQSAATQYVSNLLSDYNNLVSSEVANQPNFQNNERFFSLYDSGGSWKVLIARDNVTAAPGRAVTGGDWIEFLFVKTISASDPQISVYTNESAQNLRPILATIGSQTFSFAESATPSGIIATNITTHSAVIDSYLPASWITNASSVYDNPVLNARSAAQAIYTIDHTDMNWAVNPPFPSRGWFNTTIGHLFDAGGAVVIIITLWQFVLPHLKQKQSPRHRPSKKNKKNKDKEKQKGQATLD